MDSESNFFLCSKRTEQCTHRQKDEEQRDKRIREKLDEMAAWEESHNGRRTNKYTHHPGQALGTILRCSYRPLIRIPAFKAPDCGCQDLMNLRVPRSGCVQNCTFKTHFLPFTILFELVPVVNIAFVVCIYFH